VSKQVRHTILFGFVPGKFNAPAEETARLIKQQVDKFGWVFVGTTESQTPGVLGAVRRALGKGWQVEKAGEYIGAWHLDTLRGRVHEDGNGVAIHRRFSDVKGLPDWQNVFAGIFRLIHIESRRPFTGVVFHSNGGIEYGNGFRKGAEAARKLLSSRTGLTGIGDWAKKRFRKRPRLIVVIMGDGNLNQFSVRFRRYMKRTLGGLSIWKDSQGKIGDHGSRLIILATVYGRKITLFKGRIVRRNEVKYPKKYDHLSLSGILRFKSRKVTP
jgi:hypothetical protein